MYYVTPKNVLMAWSILENFHENNRRDVQLGMNPRIERNRSFVDSGNRGWLMLN